MRTENHAPHEIIASAFGVADKLKPLKSKKDPVIAAICGFALGGVGLGLYLRSWLDFFVPFFMLVVIVVIGIPTGEILAYFTPCFWAIYGYRRVKASNAKLKNQGHEILDAEVITKPSFSRSIQLPTSILQQTTASRLRKIDDLLNEGILSQIEYDTKREEILSDL